MSTAVLGIARIARDREVGEPRSPKRWAMRRGYTRRGFLTAAARAGAAGAAVASIPLSAVSLKAQPDLPVLVPAQRATLDAALARMIPAEGPDDWSAADLGAG